MNITCSPSWAACDVNPELLLFLKLLFFNFYFTFIFEKELTPDIELDLPNTPFTAVLCPNCCSSMPDCPAISPGSNSLATTFISLELMGYI